MPSFAHGFTQLLTVFALALVMPAWLLRMNQRVPGEAFPVGDRLDPKVELARLNKYKAEWVIVGNSMVNCRIDERYLERISGVKLRRLAEGGTQSAVWFLILKQIIAQAKKKPEWVTVFFRDTDLTWPDFRTTGVNEDLITALHGPAQPEWQQVLVRQKPGGMVATFSHGLQWLLPAQDVLKDSRQQVQSAAFTLSQPPNSWQKSVRRLELNERFGLAHLRHDLGSDSQAAAKPGGGGARHADPADVPDPGMYENGPVAFDPSPDASFLPHMIALAKQHGIKLHFHRVKRRPLANHTRPDPRSLATYLADLRSYLVANDAVYTDESHDPALTLDMYADGDHIASDAPMQRRYADNFWARVKEVIRAPQTAAPQF